MHSNEKVSKDFLMTLRAYRNGCKGLVDAYRGVVGLVAGYPDLLVGFHRFLPNSEAMDSMIS